MPLDETLKSKIRGELFRCAINGEFLTYAEFYARVKPGNRMGNFPFTPHLDAIAREERSNGYPDITFMIHRSGTAPPYPNEIEFQDSPHPPPATAGSLW